MFGIWKEDWTRERCEKESSDKKRHYDAIRAQWENITPDQVISFFKMILIFISRRNDLQSGEIVKTGLIKMSEEQTGLILNLYLTCLDFASRCQQFYKHEHGEQLKALKRVLLSYVMYNFDLSYCQVLLMSPFDVFWIVLLFRECLIWLRQFCIS